MKKLLIGLFVFSSVTAFAGPPVGYEKQLKGSFVGDENVREAVAKIENSLNVKCEFKKISTIVHGYTLWDEGGIVGLYDCTGSNISIKVKTHYYAKNKAGESLRPLDRVDGIDEVRFRHEVEKITLKYKSLM